MAFEFLSRPIHIQVGDPNELRANEDISQQAGRLWRQLCRQPARSSRFSLSFVLASFLKVKDKTCEKGMIQTRCVESQAWADSILALQCAFPSQRGKLRTHGEAGRWVEMISVSEMATVNRTSDCGEVVMLGSPDEKNGALTQALLVFCT